jgi:hypothetical protein
MKINQRISDPNQHPDGTENNCPPEATNPASRSPEPDDRQPPPSFPPAQPEPRGPHPPLFHPHGHPPPPLPPEHPNSPWESTESNCAFVRQLKELQKLGAKPEDLHRLVEAAVQDHDMESDIPGKGVHPVERARRLFERINQRRTEWLNLLRGRNVLAVGEFPPHELENLLNERIYLAQIHPLDPEGYPPRHFYELKQLDLRGYTRFEDLDENFDVLLIHGLVIFDGVMVSPLVPAVVRHNPRAEKHILESDHPAPHMRMKISLEKFIRIPPMF